MIGQLGLDRPILLVDDTNSTRYSTRRILTAAGAQVTEAVTGAEALERAADCGAVVLDVNLPDMDGFAVCHALRALPAGQYVPIVHLTAQRLRDEDKIRGLEAGADAYLTHPVDPGVLVATLNALLRTRAAERAERQARARFEAVFQTAPVGIALVARDGRLLETNPELLRILGLHGDAPATLDALPQALREGFMSHRRGGESAPWAATIAAPDGATRHLDCTVTAVGQDATLLLAADDTTRRALELERQLLLERERQARTEAEEASRAKDAFLALLSHELRNPLAPINAAAHLLQMAPGVDPRAQRASEVIGRQVAHMTKLVDDLMDVSRVTRGLVDLRREPVDLAGVVTAAIEQVRPLIETRGHVLDASTSREAWVLGDRTRLVQVVANLLNNAAKYTPAGGRIELRARVEDDCVRLTVSDNGDGIAAALLPDVFDLFTQGDRAPDRSLGGLGIGLALVRSIVQLHGGTVEAESPGLELGSTFTLTLPLVRSVGDVATPETGEADPAPQRARVLVVDDNVDAAVTLAELVGLAGHHAEYVHDARDALERVSDGARYDKFILDIGLPGMTGLELAVALRAALKGTPATFIALTGYGQANDRQLSHEAGFDHHLVKPVDAESLLAILGESGGETRPPAA